jgi:prepilin-type N-terminal cleavage/methylation domain-containing protein
MKICKNQGHRSSGFTLVELCVAMGVGSIVLVMVIGSIGYSSQAFAGLAAYVDLNATSRKALNRVTSDLRQANRCLEYSPNRVLFQQKLLLNSTNEITGTVEYIYNQNAGTLTRLEIRPGVTNRTVLLSDCSKLEFKIFQRRPVAGSFDQYDTTLNPALCKLVQLTWTCSRGIQGKVQTTETMQTAKIVLRN